MSAPLLSACIIARDEERCIGRCIGSLRGLVDEVVVARGPWTWRRGVRGAS